MAAELGFHTFYAGVVPNLCTWVVKKQKIPHQCQIEPAPYLHCVNGALYLSMEAISSHIFPFNFVSLIANIWVLLSLKSSLQCLSIENIAFLFSARIENFIFSIYSDVIIFAFDGEIGYDISIYFESLGVTV